MPSPRPDESPVPATPSELLPQLIQSIGAAASENLSFPELPIDVKRQLGRLGIFGSAAKNTASATETWRSHRAYRAQDRALGKLADNATDAMNRVDEYDQARADNTLGLSMALAWTGIRSIRASGVHAAPLAPGQRRFGSKDGLVTALITTATFDSEAAATAWHTAVQGMYNRSPVAHVVRPVAASRSWEGNDRPQWHAETWNPPKRDLREHDGIFVEHDDGEHKQPHPWMVEVTGLTEYDRIVNEATWVLIRKELAGMGVILPREKVPLDDWLKTTTLHPEIEEWLRAIDDTYRKMHESGFAVADYVDDPEGSRLKPGRREHIIATDPSAASKVMRDQRNGLIHDIRGDSGDSRYNQEQHPNRHERYYIEKDVHLRRPRPPRKSKGEEYAGPPPARPLNVAEKALIEIRETWTAVRHDPGRRIPEVLPELLGNVIGKILGGAADLAVSAGVLAFKAGTAGWKGLRNYIGDVADYWQQKQQARAQLQAIHIELHLMQQAIAKGAPDVFPEASLPPSKQLEIIKRMTAIMIERLTTKTTPDNRS